MTKTTVYLPEDLKAGLAREAALRGCSEAALIREAIAAIVARPRPTPGVFSGEPIARRADALLEGFGER